MKKKSYLWCNLFSASLCLYSLVIQIISICNGQKILMCSIFAVLLVIFGGLNAFVFIKDASKTRKHNKKVKEMNMLKDNLQ